MKLKLLQILRTKLILVIIILGIPVSVVTYFALFESVLQKKDLEVEAGIASMQIVTKVVDFQLEQVETILNNAVLSLKWEQPESGENQEILKSFVLRNNNLDAIFLVNRQGEIVASSNTEYQGLNVSDRAYFHTVLDGETVISDLLANKLTGDEMFAVAVPYYDQNKIVTAVIVSAVKKSAIAEHLNQVPLSPGCNVTVFDRSGKIIYHPFLQASPGEIGSEGEEIIAKIGQGQTGHDWFRSSNEQEKRYIFYGPIDGTNWGIALSYPGRAIWRPMLITFIRNLLIYLICLAAIYIAYQNLNLLKNKELEEERQKIAKLTMVGELAAGVAHEIRNPLTAVKGFLQLIGPDGHIVEDYYHVMYDEIEMMEKIINKLLLLSGPRDFTLAEVEICELLREFSVVVKGTALLHNVEVQLDCPGEMPSLQADRNRLCQVFMNIAKNAIEAMENGGKLIISAAVENDKEVVISFKDTGPGIPETVLQRLGSPFLTTKEKGTGLGLLVSSRIIQNHQGSLKLVNLPEGGAVVSVILPLAS